MKVLLIALVMILGMNVVTFAQKIPSFNRNRIEQSQVLGEFIPIELNNVPASVLNAVDCIYSESKIEAAAKEVDADGTVVYQFTLQSEDGVLHNVFFTDRGIELK